MMAVNVKITMKTKQIHIYMYNNPHAHGTWND